MFYLSHHQTKLQNKILSSLTSVERKSFVAALRWTNSECHRNNILLYQTFPSLREFERFVGDWRPAIIHFLCRRSVCDNTRPYEINDVTTMLIWFLSAFKGNPLSRPLCERKEIHFRTRAEPGIVYVTVIAFVQDTFVFFPSRSQTRYLRICAINKWWGVIVGSISSFLSRSSNWLIYKWFFSSHSHKALSLFNICYVTGIICVTNKTLTLYSNQW